MVIEVKRVMLLALLAKRRRQKVLTLAIPRNYSILEERKSLSFDIQVAQDS